MSIRVGLRPMGRALGSPPLEFKKDANIYSDYSLCASVPCEFLTVTPTSLGTLSITDVRLASSPASAISLITYQSSLRLYSSLASTYSLATEATP